jgi:dTDP-4-dehydrorhamnose 3,5-epimerase
MKIIKTPIKDLIILKTNLYEDNRGYFKEISRNSFFKKTFKFDCLSFSKKNTLRGFHIQLKNTQAKFVTVTHGKILDVVADVRKNSKTFGKTFSIEMSEKSDFSLFIPKGLAHAFLCKSKSCVIYYKCDEYQNKQNEKTIAWNDENLGIDWGIKKPIMSKKDQNGISLNEFKTLI